MGSGGEQMDDAGTPAPAAASSDEIILMDLQDELQNLVIQSLDEPEDLAHAGATIRGWRPLAARAAEIRARARRKLPAPLNIGGGSIIVLPSSPAWPRVLARFQELEAELGSRPDHEWQFELLDLDLTRFRISQDDEAVAEPPPADEVFAWIDERLASVESFGAEERARWQKHALQQLSSATEAATAWRVAQGWPPDVAQGYSVLMANYKEVVGFVCRIEGGPPSRVRSSAWLLYDGFAHAARLQRGAAAPHSYKHLSGRFGLLHDPPWAALDDVEGARAALAEGRQLSFVMTAPLEASADARCLDGKGYRTPVYKDVEGTDEPEGIVLYEPKPSSAIVCFRSRAADALAFRSPVLTVQNEDEIQYDLPPGTTVTLERIDEAGEWRAFDGVEPQCRCFTVAVSFVC